MPYSVLLQKVGRAVVVEVLGERHGRASVKVVGLDGVGDTGTVKYDELYGTFPDIPAAERHLTDAAMVFHDFEPDVQDLEEQIEALRGKLEERRAAQSNAWVAQLGDLYRRT